jgi:hypothetical protein
MYECHSTCDDSYKENSMSTKIHFVLICLMVSLIPLNCAPAHGLSKFQQVIQAGRTIIPPSKKNLEELHKASTLVVSCVDFRLRDEVATLLNVNLGLLDDYDEIALPGASLGLDAPQYAHCQRTIHDVIDLMKDLHHIQRIILIDHRGCGAFKLIKGEDATSTRAKEYETHKAVLLQVKSQLKTKFPKLEVYTLLMGLDGVVEVIK